MTQIYSTKCTLKYATRQKRERIERILVEYGRVVNCFIEQFKESCPKKKELLKHIVNSVDSFLGFAIRQTAAREAIDMIKAYEVLKKVQKNAGFPKHNGKLMRVSTGNLLFQDSEKSFDKWAHILGANGVFDVPIRLHRHFNRLSKKGTLCNSFLIKKDCIQFCFEISTEEKFKPQTPNNCLGIDIGMVKLIATSDGNFYGPNVPKLLQKIDRKQQGSNKQKRARREFKDFLNKEAKQLVQDAVANNKSLIVMENLKGLGHKTKTKTKTKTKGRRRLPRNIRRLLGSWNYNLLLEKIKWNADANRVCWQTVSPYKTSQTCHECGHSEYGNRKTQEKFCCLKCGHTNNADINAAQNILGRLLSGKFSPLVSEMGSTEPLEKLFTTTSLLIG